MNEQNHDEPVIQQIINDIEIRKKSQPSPAALQSYRALFSQVQQNSTNPIGEWLKALTATVSWDSRVQGLAAGARQAIAPPQSAQRTEYRLLYATDTVEIEMMVLPNPTTCHIEGEIVAIADSANAGNNAGNNAGGNHDNQATAILPAIISLHGAESEAAVAEAQSDDDGHFNLSDVRLGRYAMRIILSNGTLIQIADLELT